MNLEELATHLRQALGVQQKQDIQIAARYLQPHFAQPDSILLGDDCAAIPDGDGYLLLAAEGIWPQLIETDPWFAGWCAVMVNVSDIYAMGGRPLAVVDTIWHQPHTNSDALWAGMLAASQAYQVPIVGGHSNHHSPYDALSVAILGRSNSLLSSFKARPGDVVLMAIDLRGRSHPHYPFWNATQEAPPERLRADLSLLPQLAESGFCDAAKDISMGGVMGTLLMLLEASRCGAVLDLAAVPRPAEIPLEHWLLFFPSYGFLLSVRPDQVAAVQAEFRAQELVCEAIAHLQPSPQLLLRHKDEETLFWDLSEQPLTGFSAPIPL